MPKPTIILNLIAAILWGFNCGISVDRRYRASAIIEAGFCIFFAIIGITTMQNRHQPQDKT